MYDENKIHTSGSPVLWVNWKMTSIPDKLQMPMEVPALGFFFLGIVAFGYCFKIGSFHGNTSESTLCLDTQLFICPSPGENCHVIFS